MAKLERGEVVLWAVGYNDCSCIQTYYLQSHSCIGSISIY